MEKQISNVRIILYRPATSWNVILRMYKKIIPDKALWMKFKFIQQVAGKYDFLRKEQ